MTLNTKVFTIYNGTTGEAEAQRMPRTTIRATTSPRSVMELLRRLEKFTANPAERELYPWADRFVFGYPLAGWQRQPKWDSDQKVRFITSLWEEVDVGSYLVNDIFEYTKSATGEEYCRELSDILLDGQQRLTALEEYVLNEFPVPDAQGTPCYWEELSRAERRLFGNRTFSRATVKSWDETELRRINALRVFGGTAHTEAEKALMMGV
jgi:hypothetical protein